VIVHYFDVFRAALSPDKADPILIIDPYAVLPSAIAF